MPDRNSEFPRWLRQMVGEEAVGIKAKLADIHRHILGIEATLADLKVADASMNRTITKGMQDMAVSFDDLKAKALAEKNEIVALRGIITDLVAKVVANPTDQVAMQELADALDANLADMFAAAQAGTLPAPDSPPV